MIIFTGVLNQKDMIISMTGYGKVVRQLADKKVTVEIKSLNSKQSDLNVRMPAIYKEKELGLRSEIIKQLDRGKIDLGIFVELTGEEKNYSINTSVVKGYFEELKLLSKILSIQDSTDYMNIIMKMPDVLKTEKVVAGEKDWKKIMHTVDKALLELKNFRLNEGKVLEKDIIARIEVILRHLKKIEPFELKRINTIKTRMRKNLSEFLNDNKIDENRFEQELIYYLEKTDITEEKIRLKTHCDYFINTISEPGANGKKLGFIAQEIGREINTIGSKANDADIQKIVVQMKDELEKIKEQLFNVL